MSETASVHETPEVSRTKSSLSFFITYPLVNFALYFAVLSPIYISMALKVAHLVGTSREAGTLGLVLGVGALFAVVARPLAGRISDRSRSRFGMRRPVVIVGATGTAIGLVVAGTTASVWVLLAAWCVVQIFVNTALSATDAALPDQVIPGRRGTVSGIVGVMIPLATLVAAVMANAVSSDVARFVIPAIVGVLFSLLFVIFLKDRHNSAETIIPKFTFLEFLKSFVFNPRTNPDYGWNWLTRFFMYFGYASVFTYLPYLLGSKFHLSESAVTATFLAASIASTFAAIIASLIGGILSDRFKRRRIFVAVGSVVMVVGLLLLGLAPVPSSAIWAMLFVGLGFGSFASVDQALASQLLPDSREAAAKDLGVLNIAAALPQSVAPAVAPLIIGLGAGLAIGGYGLWYVVVAILSLTSSVFVYRIQKVR